MPRKTRKTRKTRMPKKTRKRRISQSKRSRNSTIGKYSARRRKSKRYITKNRKRNIKKKHKKYLKYGGSKLDDYLKENNMDKYEKVLKEYLTADSLDSERGWLAELRDIVINEDDFSEMKEELEESGLDSSLLDNFITRVISDHKKDQTSLKEEEEKALRRNIKSGCILNMRHQLTGENESSNKIYCNKDDCSEFSRYSKLGLDFQSTNEEKNHKVKYFSEVEREKYHVTVNGGKFYYADGSLIEHLDYKKDFERLETPGSPYSIFVFIENANEGEEVDGSLYMIEKNYLQIKDSDDLIQHSSLTSGGPVLCAGLLYINGGYLEKVWINSGHYQPSGRYLCNFFTYLKRNGVNLDNVKFVDPINAREINVVNKMESNLCPNGIDGYNLNLCKIEGEKI